MIIPNYDHLFKVLLVSYMGVGKSSFILRYCKDQFTDSYNMNSTIGDDFLCKMVNIDNKLIKLQIWDSYSRYGRYQPPYRGTGVLLLMYDITNLDTFHYCFDLVKDGIRFCGDDVVIILVGTKLDIVDMDSSKRQVSHEKALIFAQDYQMDFIEISSKFNINLDSAILKSVSKAYNRKVYKEQQLPNENNNINNKNNKFSI